MEEEVNRSAIRDWVSEKRQILEAAQAGGTLARTKLDIKDEAQTKFATAAHNQPARFDQVLEQELEAFCSDMRLAALTVQQQVERRIPHTARAIILALIAAVVTLFIAALNVKDPVVGFGSPIVVGTLVFFLAR